MNNSVFKAGIALLCLATFAALLLAQKNVPMPPKGGPKVNVILPAPAVGPLLPPNRRATNQIAACNGYNFLELNGNFYCDGFCSGDLNPGPDPGTAATGDTVTYGVTPHSFNAAGNVVEDSGIMIDFGNGTNSSALPLTNDQGVQATTKYATVGHYNVRSTAVMQNNYVANGWHCHYRCCRYANTAIDIH
jgi:hypothetical protein